MHWLSTWVLARCPLPPASHSSSMLQGSASIEPTSLSSLCRRVPSVAALMLSTACTAHRSDSTTPKMGKSPTKKILNPGGSLSLHLRRTHAECPNEEGLLGVTQRGHIDDLMLVRNRRLPVEDLGRITLEHHVH